MSNTKKVSNKQVSEYLIDCLGYDGLFIDHLLSQYDNLLDCLDEAELQECLEYIGG